MISNKYYSVYVGKIISRNKYWSVDSKSYIVSAFSLISYIQERFAQLIN